MDTGPPLGSKKRRIEGWWRRSLEVTRTNNPSTHLLIKCAAEVGGAASRERGLTPEEIEQRRERELRHNLRRHLRPGGGRPQWAPSQLQMLGTMPDDEVADRIGKTVEAVHLKRQKHCSLLRGRESTRGPRPLAPASSRHPWPTCFSAQDHADHDPATAVEQVRHTHGRTGGLAPSRFSPKIDSQRTILRYSPRRQNSGSPRPPSCTTGFVCQIQSHSLAVILRNGHPGTA